MNDTAVPRNLTTQFLHGITESSFAHRGKMGIRNWELRIKRPAGDLRATCGGPAGDLRATCENIGESAFIGIILHFRKKWVFFRKKICIYY